MEHLLVIIDRFGGNKSALATALRNEVPDSKLSQAHINNWIYRDKKIPAEWIIPLSKVVNYEVTPHQLNSVLYPCQFDGLPKHIRSAA